MQGFEGKRVLLVIGGGIAAYKTLDLIRRLKERGARVRAIMTRAAHHFVTPLSVGALTGEAVHTDLFDLDRENEIGHIRLARDCDLVVVAPATADLMARMANGLADDLATAVLLATDRPVFVAPAMNPHMWDHPATRRNADILRADGIRFVGPESGEMAEPNEAGEGRMSEPLAIVDAVARILAPKPGPLAGRRALVTSGPTHEPIDPVRYIANRSSGRQGHAIAAALAAAGAEVTLVSGPVSLAPPTGIRIVAVETAEEMLQASLAALPADIAIFAAAVADWRAAEPVGDKVKKDGSEPQPLALVENPDILATVSRHADRPALVIGFAAETRDLLANAADKLKRKGCDWIVANDVSTGTNVMGGERNRVHLVSAEGVEDWPDMTKAAVAARLVARIALSFGAPTPEGRRTSALPESAKIVEPVALPVERLGPTADDGPEPFEGGTLDIRPVR